MPRDDTVFEYANSLAWPRFVGFIIRANRKGYHVSALHCHSGHSPFEQKQKVRAPYCNYSSTFKSATE